MGTNELIEQLPTMSDEELWNIFKDLYEEGRFEDELYKDIKYGVNNLLFDFEFYLEYKDDERYIKDMYISYRKKVGKQKYNIFDFLDELNRRRSLMRRNIEEELTDDENETKGR